MKCTYLESEGDALFPSLGHQGFVHGCLGGLVVCWGVQLYLLEPDVFPEGQANDIQVLATVAESGAQLNPGCRDTRQGEERQGEERQGAESTAVRSCKR